MVRFLVLELNGRLIAKVRLRQIWDVIMWSKSLFFDEERRNEESFGANLKETLKIKGKEEEERKWRLFWNLFSYLCFGPTYSRIQNTKTNYKK